MAWFTLDSISCLAIVTARETQFQVSPTLQNLKLFLMKLPFKITTNNSKSLYEVDTVIQTLPTNENLQSNILDYNS